VESSGARKMGRPAFHPPPGVKGEGKGARSRAREGSEGGRGIEVGSVGSQPCTPTASPVKLFALSAPLSISYSSISFSLTFRRLSLTTRGSDVFPELPESDIFHVPTFPCFNLNVEY